MKTIRVNTTTDINPLLEDWYVSPVYSWGRILPFYSRHMCDDAIAHCIVEVSRMFPGTYEEWDAWIMACIGEALVEEGLAYKTEDWGILLIKNYRNVQP